MSPYSPTLGALRQRLREGAQPKDLPFATYLGSGSYRDAYRVGRFVVKENVQREQWSSDRDAEQRAWLRELGVRPVPMVREGSWVVQTVVDTSAEYDVRCHVSSTVRRMFYRQDRYGLDIHGDNIGFDSRGRLTAFDY